ncbi:MAG: hypothetical protein JXR45_24395 [Deltaproteobacteria bacterium]|nr:hypothetical protein [Deltaproteobacteria bacterium]
MGVLFSILLFISFLPGCYRSAPANRLEVYRLQQTHMARPMDFSLLRGPVNASEAANSLPVFVLLHGMGGDHQVLDKYGISEQLLSAMKKHEIPSANFILPNGERGFYLNWHDGTHPYEDTLIQDIIPSALQILGYPPSQPLHIIGVSMGGQGALRIGLNYPHRFVSISVFSTLIFTQEEAMEMLHRPLVRLFLDAERIWGDGTDETFTRTMDVYGLSAELEDDLKPRIFITSGTEEDDVFTRTAIAFTQHLTRNNVPHMYQSFDGGHGWKYWEPIMGDAIRYALNQ